MTLLTKTLAGLLLVASLLGAALWQRNRVLGQQLQAERQRAATLALSLTATRNSLDTYVARAKETDARADRRQKELTRGLQPHTDWRDTPVPDAVFDGLYHNRSRETDTARDPAR